MTQKLADRNRHDRERETLLEILASKGVGQAMPFDDLQFDARLRHRPMTAKALEFHLRYMADKGWIEFRAEDTEERLSKITVAWITHRGIDKIDLGNNR